MVSSPLVLPPMVAEFQSRVFAFESTAKKVLEVISSNRSLQISKLKFVRNGLR
jgi:hypothetical protein